MPMKTTPCPVALPTVPSGRTNCVFLWGRAGARPAARRARETTPSSCKPGRWRCRWHGRGISPTTARGRCGRRMADCKKSIRATAGAGRRLRWCRPSSPAPSDELPPPHGVANSIAPPILVCVRAQGGLGLAVHNRRCRGLTAVELTMSDRASLTPVESHEGSRQGGGRSWDRDVHPTLGRTVGRRCPFGGGCIHKWHFRRIPCTYCAPHGKILPEAFRNLFTKAVICGW